MSLRPITTARVKNRYKRTNHATPRSQLLACRCGNVIDRKLVYYCRSLAIAYIEYNCLQRFHELTTDQDTPAGLRPVLTKLCTLYGLWSLSSHMATLYQGDYLSGGKPAELVQMAILTLCSQLKDDAVALVDVFAPPDFILNSPIGNADGQLYKNLWSAVMQGSQVLERPSWWKEFCSDKPVVGSLRPKL